MSNITNFTRYSCKADLRIIANSGVNDYTVLVAKLLELMDKKDRKS
jgi:hypothetical protein